MDSRVESLEKDVNRLKSIATAIGIVAVIFGVTGAWGYKVLSDTKAKIEELSKSEEYFSNLRKKVITIYGY